VHQSALYVEAHFKQAEDAVKADEAIVKSLISDDAKAELTSSRATDAGLGLAAGSIATQ
jgi:hypothetical protein